METVNEKLNKALGINDGSDVDNILSDLDGELQSIKDNMDLSFDKIDKCVTTVDIHSYKESFAELSQLIKSSGDMLEDVRHYISESDILDPDVIRSGADLIKASREVLSEYMDVYKIKMIHYNNIEIEMLKSENKRKLEKYKHDLKNEGNVVDDEEYITYVQEEVVSVMDKIEKGVIK